MRETLPSIPPSQPESPRHLGSGQRDSAIKAQMLLALGIGLVMIAIPLCLWKRPAEDAMTAPLGAPPKAEEKSTDFRGIRHFDAGLSPLPKGKGQRVEAPPPPPEARLDDVVVKRCTKPGVGRTPPEQCDRLTSLERDLARAIREQTRCGPKSRRGSSVNFVLNLDFKRRKSRLWAGRSGSVSGRRARKVLRCVRGAMAAIDWKQPHLHRRYQFAIKAHYPKKGSR